jgi:tetratricopeptide (TPR) repeat protein
VRLFVERVRSLLPKFSLDASVTPAVVDICRRLDGLPLAIELAAARVPALGVDGVRERLDERFRILTGGSRVAPRRHQTLRAALDWSHSLLSDEERAVYRRLGIFVGSFSLESAQQLAADDELDEWAALEALNSLVDKSLVMAEGAVRPRYRLLESTREHALEQLASARETDRWMALHARATLSALQAAIHERRTDQVLAEMGNVRIAYRWAHDAGEAELAVGLATLPAMALAVEGAVEESRERLLEVEPLVDDSVPKRIVALYWQWLGRIGLGGRLPASRCFQAFRRAEQMFVALGNDRHVHACRRQLAEALLDVGDLDGARACLAGAKAIEAPGWPVADTMRRLRVEGLCSAQAGRFDEALQTSERALEMAQGAAIDRYEVVLLEDIARMHLERGDPVEAARRYRALAERARPMQNGGFILAKALTGLVAALTAADDLDAAADLLHQSLPAIARSGNVLADVDVFASLIARRGDLALAACLLTASDRFRDRVETRRVPIVQRCRDEVATQIAEQATPELAAEWRRVGESMSEADVVRSIAASLAAARTAGRGGKKA